MLRIAVFGSGRGSNFKSIVDAVEEGTIPVKIVKVIVNEPNADMIEVARENYLNAVVVPHHQLSREDHEKAIIRELEHENLDLICLAGYMRILSPYFINNISVPIINIHPSLLPSFPGINAQKQALECGVKITGCTIHVVNEEVDGGKILAQTAVRVEEDDTVDSLSNRILREEHKIYPKVLFDLAMGNISLSIL